jgi:hypothetical protein
MGGKTGRTIADFVIGGCDGIWERYRQTASGILVPISEPPADGLSARPDVRGPVLSQRPACDRHWNGFQFASSNPLRNHSMAAPGTTFSYDGGVIQTFTVATNGTYDITAYGGQGGFGAVDGGPSGGTGGLGAEIGGDFSLVKGEVLHIVVGGYGTPSGLAAGGGGGGGFNNDLPGYQGGGGQVVGSGSAGVTAGVPVVPAAVVAVAGLAAAAADTVAGTAAAPVRAPTTAPLEAPEAAATRAASATTAPVRSAAAVVVASMAAVGVAAEAEAGLSMPERISWALRRRISAKVTSPSSFAICAGRAS